MSHYANAAAIQGLARRAPRALVPQAGFCARGVVLRRRGFELTCRSLDVAPGCFVGVLGANGCGKSALLRGLAGVESLHRGMVTFGTGSVASGLRELSLRALASWRAYLPQLAAAQFPMTVGEFVGLGRAHVSRWYRAQDDVRAVAFVLEDVGLAGFAGRSVAELSGGEQQRACLARSLYQGAPNLLLDEPTSALDVKYRVRMFKLLRQQCDQGAAVVVATHDVQEAVAHCDRLVVLHGGRVLVDGDVDSVIWSGGLQKAYGASLRCIPHAGGRFVAFG